MPTAQDYHAEYFVLRSSTPNSERSAWALAPFLFGTERNLSMISCAGLETIEIAAAFGDTVNGHSILGVFTQTKLL